jgi:hypothetical protein
MPIEHFRVATVRRTGTGEAIRLRALPEGKQENDTDPPSRSALAGPPRLHAATAPTPVYRVCMPIPPVPARGWSHGPNRRPTIPPGTYSIIWFMPVRPIPPDRSPCQPDIARIRRSGVLFAVFHRQGPCGTERALLCSPLRHRDIRLHPPISACNRLYGGLCLASRRSDPHIARISQDRMPLHRKDHQGQLFGVYGLLLRSFICGWDRGQPSDRKSARPLHFLPARSGLLIAKRGPIPQGLPSPPMTATPYLLISIRHHQSLTSF